jgi:hypothetical protein
MTEPIQYNYQLRRKLNYPRAPFNTIFSVTSIEICKERMEIEKASGRFQEAEYLIVEKAVRIKQVWPEVILDTEEMIEKDV